MKSADHEELAARLRLLGHPDRLRLMQLMCDVDRFPDNLVSVAEVGVCVNDLARAAGMPQSTASSHLSALKRAGLIATERRGQFRYARVDQPQLADLAERMVAVAATG